ncbi:MAG: hypothetical protein WBI63_08065, partial [Coriobacteriia bacterium]
VVYVYPTVGETAHDEAAARFAESYRKYVPGCDHILHVVFNGQQPNATHRSILADTQYQTHQHDDVGWDTGAYLKVASEIDCDLMVCLGGSSYFMRAGWLSRMAEAYCEHGLGLYGSSASLEITPHIRTTGFWCHPTLLRAYPRTVRSKKDRYAFEHGPASLTRLAEYVGLGCWLVTWDAVYAKPQWRTPPNIFRRGDQSNSIVFDRQFGMYEDWDEATRLHYAALADGEG